jgi:outer membrane autotransporter protein
LAGIYAHNGLPRGHPAGTDLSVTTGVGTTVKGGFDGIFAFNFGKGALTITANGKVEGTAHYGIKAQNSSYGTDLSVTTGVGAKVIGGNIGIFARNYGSEALTIKTYGNVTGNNVGIYAGHFAGGQIDITVGSESTVTNTGTGADDFAVDIRGGPGSVTLAGTLTGGGALLFDQDVAQDDRLELHPTAIVNGNVLAGDGSDTLAFGGSGDGAFDLSNIDTGASPQQYRGFEIFQVESGTWTFSGATTEAFTVEGGTLMGTGTFGGLTVNGGTLAPGNSIGTMTVNGAFTLGAGAVYEVEVNAAGQNDKVIVNGTVNLTGATLRVLAANGNYKPKTDYVIIDNDGSDAVTGVFATITSSLAFLTPIVFYNGGTGNDVVLTLIGNGFEFGDVADTPNQKAVADALSGFPTNNALFLAVLNQTSAGARQAFDALSGEIHATVAGVLADDSRYVREAIMGRLMQAGHTDNSLGAAGPQMASLDQNAMALGYGGKSLAPPPSSPLAFWTSAFGAWGNYDGNRNAATADRDLGGFVSGMDAQLSGTWRVGLATGASFSNIDVSDRYSSADVDSYHLAGYAGGMAGSFALRGGGAWAWNDIDTSRAVVFPGFYERQKASYDADTGQLFGEVAYPTTMGGMAVEPFVGYAYVSVDTDNFKEHGGNLASLRGRDTDQDVGYSALGVRVATTMHWGSMLVTPHVSAAWQHAFDDVTPGAALAFTSTGIGFNVTGVPLAEDSALIDAGLDFAVGTNATAGVSYSGQFGDGVQDNAVKGRFTWLF